MFNLTGKAALVTGASYGTGYAIAKGLVNAEAKIVLMILMNKCLENYKSDGIDAKGYVCDVTDEYAVNAVVL